MALITDLDDRTLVEHHHAGDEEAFRLIVERHHRSMYANAMRRLHDSALAEDAVQEAFLRAFRALPRFNGDYHLDAWLHRILTNVCHDIGRRRGRDTRLFDRACGEHDVAAPPADDLFEAVPRQQLETALGSLPENYREVLLLRFVDELSYSDVALKAGISEENARARVSRGRAMLRRMLEGASAAIFWLIPPLRRNQLTGGEADLANQINLASSATPIVSQAAPAASQSTPVLAQATNFVSQAMPGIVQAAPAVTSSAPAMGKAAVAVGIAASVAIPAGVAVEKKLEKPQPAVAAPADATAQAAPDDPVEVAAPSTTVQVASDQAASPTTSTTDAVAALGDGGAVGATIDGSTTTSTTETSDDTSSSDGTSSTTSPSTSAPTQTEPTADEPAAEEPADDDVTEPAPPPSGELSSSLTVVEAGPRLELDGDFSLTVDGQSVTGTLTGKLLVGDADAKDPEAPRDVEGDVLLQFADGTTADLRIRGQVTVTTKGDQRFHDLAVVFRLDGGAAHHLAESGELTGTLQTGDGSGALHLVLPGASSTESSGS